MADNDSDSATATPAPDPAPSEETIISDAVASIDTPAPASSTPDSTAAPATTDVPAETAKDKPAEEDPTDRAWSTIRRKEKELVDARAQIKQQQEAVTAERKQFEALGESVRKMQADVRADPIGFIQRAAGYTMDDLVRMALGKEGGSQPSQNASPKADSPVMQELARLRELVEAQKKENESYRQQQESDRLIAQYRVNISEALKDPRYELLSAYQAVGQDGSLMTAADVIEYRAALAASQGDTDLTPTIFADRLLSEYRETLQGQASHSAVRQVLGLGDTEKSPAATSGNGTSQAPQSITNSLVSPRRPSSDDLPDLLDEDAIITMGLRAMSD